MDSPEAIQLELLKSDCLRLMDWVRSSNYPQDETGKWIATNILSGLRRAEIELEDDMGVIRKMRAQLASLRLRALRPVETRAKDGA